MTRLGAPVLLLGFALCFGCSRDPSPEYPFGDDTALEPAGPTGRIRGIVRLDGEPPAPEFEPIPEDQDICGDSALLPRLDLGEGNGIQHAFVYLEGDQLAGIRNNRQSSPPESVLVDQRECEYVPHALVMSVGTQLEVTNSDSILHNVRGREETVGSRPRPLFNIAQPIRGQRTKINSPLTEPGIVSLSCEAGHPWMSAHILVTDHPYVTVTADAGEFVIDNVPPGTYSIKMWHEGVRLVRIIRSLQRYDYEDPYEITQEVTVEADTETLVDFTMVLREES